MDLRGQRFGYLTVLEEAGRGHHGQVRWLCLCDCGNEHVVLSQKLRKSRVRSCGCAHFALLGKASTTHGHTVDRVATPEYYTWSSMIQRCTNENNIHFDAYGGRGISVCAEWRAAFEPFLEYIGTRPSDAHSIDRIDTNGNYEPGNVRWAVKEIQSNNTRSNVYLTYAGRRQSVAQWSRETGIGASTLAQRVRLGWTPERALTEQPDARRSGRPKRAS